MITVTLWILMLAMLILVRILAVILNIPMYYQLEAFMNSMTMFLMIFKFSVVMMGFVYETKRK